MHWENHAHALAQTLVVPANASKIGFPILDSPEKVQRKDVNNAAQLPTATSVSLIAHRPKSTRSTTNSTGESPIPKLDSFVLTTLGKRGGAEGRIRAWSMGYMNGEGNHGSYLLTYQMCVNRW